MSFAIWEKLSGSGGPEGRWGHTCNAIRGRKLLYIFGGYKKEKYTNEVDVFDSENRIWREVVIDSSTPPVPRANHSCTTIGDKLFVFGGTDGRMPLDDLHILDTSTNTWILPCVSGVPEPREGHSASLVGERLFIFGGCAKFVGNEIGNEIYYDDLYILEIETLRWNLARTSGTPPSKRSGHTASSWKNQIVVIGGEDSYHYLSDVHILDTDTLVWSKLDTTGHVFPPRRSHTTISCGRSLFVFGGFSDEVYVFNDLHLFDIETNAWMKVIPLGEGPCERFSMAGERLDPQGAPTLIFIGGCNNLQGVMDDVYLLRIEKTSIGRSKARTSKARTSKARTSKAQTIKAREEGIYKIRVPGAKSVLEFGNDFPSDMDIDSDSNMDIDPNMDSDIHMITCPDFANDPYFNQAESSWLFPTNYIFPVRDQEKLEVCWAFVAVSNMFSDQLINHHSAEIGSVQELVERVHYFYPCQRVTNVPSKGLRNTMANAYLYAERFGVYPERLLPLQDRCFSTFDAGKGERMPWIPLRFEGDGLGDYKIHVKSHGQIPNASLYDKIEKILRKQPIGGAVKMSLSFTQLKPDETWEGPNGVEGSEEYLADTEAFDGELHAVDIVSFGGKRGENDFFNVKNNWGFDWCKDGYGRIRRHAIVDHSISYPFKSWPQNYSPHPKAFPMHPPLYY